MNSHPIRRRSILFSFILGILGFCAAATPGVSSAQDSPILTIAPTFRDVSADGGSTSFEVSNIGVGIMDWTAATSEGWITFAGGQSGTDTGNIVVNFEPNPGAARVGTITVTASSASNSPQTVQLKQGVLGPRVIGHSPSAAVNLKGATLDSITLEFDQPIDFDPSGSGSFWLEDVSIRGPSGHISPINIEALGAMQYRISFPPQDQPGNYSVSVGPWITDPTGMPMDQDADGQAGEDIEDVFTFSFTAVRADTVFSTDGTIPDGDTTYDGQSLYVEGCTLTIDGVHAFSAFHVGPGATVSHTAGQTGFELEISGDLTVDAGGAIAADGKGWSPGQGPGAGNNNGYYSGLGSGGAYGGSGGIGDSNTSESVAGGIAYGSVTSPMALGSGGGEACTQGESAGWGGGAIRLSVGGGLQLDGIVSASGTGGTHVYTWWRYTGGGGSGGSIYITAGTLSGAGMIRADGGAGFLVDWGNWQYSGGGGGGRIAIQYETKNFTGSITAKGGAGFEYGGAGTVFLRAVGQSLGHLMVSNGGSAGATTPLIDTTNQFHQIDATDEGHLEVPSGNTLIWPADELLLKDKGRLTLRGALLPSSQTTSFDLISIGSGAYFYHAPGGRISANEVEILADGTFVLDGVASFANLHIASDGRLTHSLGRLGFDLTITGDLTVDSGGAIWADGLGYPGGQGPGAGFVDVNGMNCGGGYGGAGGGGPLVGSPYCPASLPVELGSGGSNTYNGGAGGGAIRLNVGNALTVNGAVSANGSDASATYWGKDGAGGGAGGSILLLVGSLRGNGAIAANGGVAFSGWASVGGGGGGGRIVLYCDTNEFAGSISADGGSGFENGDTGVIQLVSKELPLQLNRQVFGRLESACGMQIHELSAIAGQQLRLEQVSSSAPWLVFDLVGPNGWRGFSGLPGESELFTLTESGRYLLTVRDTDQTTQRVFSFRLAETSVTDLAP